ncbi:murein transglycosylase super family [Candidatus Termititenax persephonae]|uniref:Murein transglycosylase super family n=1 Tax=Candidatus Termititenax persephonae TaxID=2218525 RepID=A0A388TET7_9BACT|nr:murein transglycosylase super family [Candidatus Termititenax persephonae]
MINWRWLLFAVLCGGILLFGGWRFYNPLSGRELKTYSFYDRQGRLIGILSADGGPVRTWVALDKISPAAQNVFISLEDQRFYRHAGIDFWAVGRAMLENGRQGKLTSGASTITQQLAKNILNNQKRNLWHKMVEALLAVYLEIKYSKAEILENYFNRIYYGNLIGGINTAARFYFQKTPQELNVKEAVALALLAKSPVVNQQRLFDHTLAKEIDRGLAYLADRGVITKEEQDYYQKVPLAVKPALNEKILAPNFLYAVLKAEARQKKQRTKITTTLDYELQAAVVNIIKEELARLKDKHINNAAAIVIENKSGEILAYVGSADFYDSSHAGQIDGVLSYRQPGSALKPFLYYLALENGFSPATILPDIKMSFPAGNGVYNPRNYDDQYHGPVTLRHALGNSLNIPAIYLLSQVGGGKFLALLQQLGFKNLTRSPEHYGLGLALGNGEVSLFEISKAYACLANAGIYFKNLLFTKEEQLERLGLLAADKVFLITDLLSDNAAREAAFGPNNSLKLPFPAAAKTGTTKDFRDNWAVGYTTEVTVGVWVGNHDQSEMRNSSGITGAGPLFRKILLKTSAKYPAGKFAQPAEIVSRNICLESGLLSGSNCLKTRSEFFSPHNLPPAVCAQHAILRGRPTFIYPAIYRDWLAENFPRQEYALQEDRPLKPSKFHILYPPHDAYFAVDPVLSREDQRLTLKVDNELATEWYVDGQFIGQSGLTKNVAWQLEQGTHTIEAWQDKQGTAVRINVY